MRRRDLALALILLLPVGGLWGFAWLTQHPDVAWLERAEGWPLVGQLAARFRTAYLQAEEPALGAPAAVGPEIAARRPAQPAAGEPEAAPDPGRIDPDLLGAHEYVWLEPGAVLRRAPDPAAEEVARLGVIANVPVLDRQGAWTEVAYRRQRGWVELAPEGAGAPPMGREPAPTLPLPAQPPEPAQIARAAEILGPAGPADRLGPYRLYTDHDDAPLLAFLDRAAAGLEAAYRRRTGRQPMGRAAEAVVFFRQEEGYRAFLAGEERLATLLPTGHAGAGLVALYAGDRPWWEIGATLIHELTHLLNRRALGPALPPWLDEGLADDLGSSRFDAEGGLVLGSLGGLVTRTGDTLELHGARASLLLVQQAVADGRLRALPSLLAMDWRRFVAPPDSQLHYAHATFFVRYLLDGEGGALAPGFRSYLAAIARGGPATAEALLPHLDLGWRQLGAGFRAWLRMQGDPAPAAVLIQGGG